MFVFFTDYLFVRKKVSESCFYKMNDNNKNCALLTDFFFDKKKLSERAI